MRRRRTLWLVYLGGALGLMACLLWPPDDRALAEHHAAGLAGHAAHGDHAGPPHPSTLALLGANGVVLVALAARTRRVSSGDRPSRNRDGHSSAR